MGGGRDREQGARCRVVQAPGGAQAAGRVSVGGESGRGQGAGVRLPASLPLLCLMQSWGGTNLRRYIVAQPYNISVCDSASPITCKQLSLLMYTAPFVSTAVLVWVNYYGVSPKGSKMETWKAQNELALLWVLFWIEAKEQQNVVSFSSAKQLWWYLFTKLFYNSSQMQSVALSPNIPHPAWGRVWRCLRGPFQKLSTWPCLSYVTLVYLQPGCKCWVSNSGCDFFFLFHQTQRTNV